MFTNISADADKIFYCDATFDNNVEINKFNSYVLFLRVRTKKYHHKCNINGQVVFCVIFGCVLERNSEELSPYYTI